MQLTRSTCYHAWCFMFALSQQSYSFSVSKVDAKRTAALASAALKCGMTSSRLTANISKGHGSKNVSRGVHRAFKQHKADADIELSHIKDHPIIKPSSILTAAIKRGHLCTSPKHLKKFWDHYKASVPTHEVFNLPEQQLNTCIPIVYHGDDGRGKKKTPITVLSLQSAMNNDGTSHNTKQATWFTRFLFTVVDAKTRKQHPHLIDDLLDGLAVCLKALFDTGLEVDNTHYRFACVGMKGDWPWLVKCGHLNASFSNVSKNKQHSRICHLCQSPSWDNCHDKTWKESAVDLGNAQQDLPWDNESPLLKTPFAPDRKAAFYQIDLFHTTKQGCGRDFVASSVAVLAEMDFFPNATGSKSFANCLNAAFSSLLDFCNRHKLRKPFISQFTKDNLGTPKKACFPKASFKGSDVSLMLRWLEEATHSATLVQTNMVAEDDATRDKIKCAAAIHIGCKAMNSFFRSCYRSKLYLIADTAAQCVRNGTLFLNTYSWLASFCLSRSRCRFPLRPKLHTLAHIVEQMQQQRSQTGKSFNPLMYNCEMDEDFIGRISRISRRCHDTTTALRTIQIACYKYHQAWDRKRSV